MTIRVCSRKDEDLVDVKATFSHDLEDNYISKHLVDQLDLNGRQIQLGRKSIVLLG
jgi:hypothetical protein